MRADTRVRPYIKEGDPAGRPYEKQKAKTKNRELKTENRKPETDPCL
jgi:hypothetical protein